MTISIAYIKELFNNGVKDYQKIIDTKFIPNYEITSHKQIRLSIISERCKNANIPIHRHKYFEIVVVTKAKEGEHFHEIDFVEYPLKAGYIYFIYPNQTHKWNIKEYKEEFDGYILNFNEAFLLENGTNIKHLLSKLFNSYENNPYIKYKENEFESFFSLMQIFEKEYNKDIQNNSILRSLLETLLFYMEELKIESNKILDINFQKLTTLKNLIEENYKKEKNSDFYARKMQLSSKRLNEIVKKVSGYTITQMIHTRLVLEAKREMVSQNKTIQAISEELGFENPSYFSRFFKKYENLTPKEYSKKLLK
jgi:AraC family transcriptional regulator, transcriptional activator of pobA